VITALPRGIDALIGLFSPERCVRRMLAREVMGRARRLDRIRRETYAAAKSNRLVGPWSPANTNVNDIIGASSSTVRARVRQLVRDFPYFARAVNIIVDYVVGAGIVYQARIQDGSGKLDRKTNQPIEDVFARWADDADISGRAPSPTYAALFEGKELQEETPTQDPPIDGKLTRAKVVEMVENYFDQGLSHRQAFMRIAERYAQVVRRPVSHRGIESRYYKAMACPA